MAKNKPTPNLRDRKIASVFGSKLMLARFYAKVIINEKTGCHEWQGCRHSNGYGQVRYDGVVEGAHRIAWRLVNGDPGDLYVLHHCDNRRCVNVKHLFLGTQADNGADRKLKGRKWGVGKQFKPWRPVPEWRRPW